MLLIFYPLWGSTSSVASYSGTGDSTSLTLSGYPSTGLRSLLASSVPSTSYSITGYPSTGLVEYVGTGSSTSLTLTGYSSVGLKSLLGSGSSTSYSLIGYSGTCVISYIGSGLPASYTITGYSSKGYGMFPDPSDVAKGVYYGYGATLVGTMEDTTQFMDVATGKIVKKIGKKAVLSL